MRDTITDPQNFSLFIDKNSSDNFKSSRIEQDNVELVDDLDDLDEKQLHNLLVRANVIRDTVKKFSDFVVPNDIHCQSSIYLFHRKSKFRRICYFVQ